jgi:hypothetical protein
MSLTGTIRILCSLWVHVWCELLRHAVRNWRHDTCLCHRGRNDGGRVGSRARVSPLLGGISRL